MPSVSPRKSRTRYSDPSSASLTPLDGTFSRLSTSSRAHSLSPRKRATKQPLHIRMNLTEMQMDRITDAFTKRVDGSPGKTDQANDSPEPQSHTYAYQSPHGGRDDTTSPNGATDQEGRYSRSTTFSELMPRAGADTYGHSIAERRKKTTPAPIEVEDHRRRTKATPQRARLESIPAMVSPLVPQEMYNAGRAAYFASASSTYTQDYHPSQQPEPLRPYGSPVQGQAARFESPSKAVRGDSRKAPLYTTSTSPTPRARQSQSAVREAGQHGSNLAVPPAVNPSMQQMTQEPVTPIFSPLRFYFRGSDFPSEKMGGKTMIGEKGWLERTDPEPEKAKKGNAKRFGILDGIKKIAKDMSEFHNPGRRSQQAMKDLFNSQLSISLDAREQSLLYGELEFHLSNALNSYITIQLEKGRLVTDKLKKIGDAWLQQGRPRVVGFRYDLETQIELVFLHMDEFVFTGRRQGNPDEIAGLLHAMKTNARVLRIRTFCQPDTVIARQLLDSQSLFNMIGASQAEDFSLAEIAQFFKVCVERERKKVQKESNKARKSRVEHRQRQEDRDGQFMGATDPETQADRPVKNDDDDEWLYYRA